MKTLTYDPENSFRKAKLYALYWLGYILLCSLIQGLPAGDFLTAF